MKSRIVVVLALAVAMLSCKSSSPTAPAPTAPASSEILIDPVERLSDHSLMLTCRTVNEFPCSNYFIDTRVTRTTGRVEIEFLGIVEPPVCLTAPGPARATVLLSPLPEGSTELVLRNRILPIKGAIVKTPDHYDFQAGLGDVRFLNPRLERIPPGTIWGMFGYFSEAEEPAVTQLESDLEALGARPLALAPGHYSVRLSGNTMQSFNADAQGHVNFDGTSGYNHTRTFSYAYTGDPASLSALAARAFREHGDLLHMRIFTSSGDVILSWVVGRAS